MKFFAASCTVRLQPAPFCTTIVYSGTVCGFKFVRLKLSTYMGEVASTVLRGVKGKLYPILLSVIPSHEKSSYLKRAIPNCLLQPRRCFLRENNRHICVAQSPLPSNNSLLLAPAVYRRSTLTVFVAEPRNRIPMQFAGISGSRACNDVIVRQRKSH